MTGCVLHTADSPTDADIGFLCHAHYARTRSSLLELQAVDTWLRTQIAAGGSTALGERVAGSREDPIPLRTDILDLIGPVAPSPSIALFRDPDHQAGDPSILDEMRSWAMLVEDDSGDEWPDRRTLAGTLSYLAAHLTWIANQAWVDEFHREIAGLHRRAHRVAPWRAETRRDPNPCGTCGTRAIILYLAEGRSVCERRLGGCGRTMTWDHRREESESA